MSNNPQLIPPLGEGSGSPSLIPFIVAIVVLVVTAVVFAIRQRQLGAAVHERNVLLEDKKQQDLAIKEATEKREIDKAISETLKIEKRIARLDDLIIKTRIADTDLKAQLAEVNSWSDLEVK